MTVLVGISILGIAIFRLFVRSGLNKNGYKESKYFIRCQDFFNQYFGSHFKHLRHPIGQSGIERF